MTIGVGLCSIVLSVWRWNHLPVGLVAQDDARYIVLAQSLAAGRGYRLISYPSAPVEQAFPPGWPLLLSPLARLDPWGFDAFKGLTFLLWLATLAALWSIVRGRLPSVTAVGLTALTALNPFLIGSAVAVMSEIPYLCLTTVACALWLRRDRGGPWLPAVALGAAGAAVLVRTIGVTLLVPLLLHLALRGRAEGRIRPKPILLLLAAAVVAAIVLLAGNDAAVLSTKYIENVRFIAARLTEYVRFWRYLPILPWEVAAQALIPGLGSDSAESLLGPVGVRVASGVVLLTVCVGWLASWRVRNTRWLAGYGLLYAIVLYLWSAYIATVQLRIVLPLVPLLYYYMLGGVQTVLQLGRGVRSPGTQRLAAYSIAILVLLSIAFNIRVARQPIRDRFVDLSGAAAWVEAHVSADAVFMTVEPVADYLYLRRLTVPYPPTAGGLDDAWAADGVDFLLWRPVIGDRPAVLRSRGPLPEALAARVGHGLEMVYADPAQNVYILARRQPPTR